MKVYGYVYMVRNKVNGKIYFGITEDDFDTRYRSNIEKNTHNEHLQNSIKKYGIENFEINEQFDIAYTEDDLYDLEDMYICLYNTLDSKYGYNKRRSGHNHKGAGKPSEESRRKMSEAQKKRCQQEDYVNPFKGKGKPLTEKTKQKMSKSLKTAYEQGLVHPMQNQHHTEETKRKMSEAHKGKKRSEETKQKISESLQGHKPTNDKKVICIETGQVFDTIEEAKEWCGVKNGISACCRGQRKTAGGYSWMYYSDYLEQQNKDNTEVTQEIKAS